MKPLRPLFFFVALILFVGLACSAVGGGADPTQAPPPTQPVQVVNPTSPPPPTQAPPTEPPPTEAPTEPPAPESQAFFDEEFDTPLSGDWDVLTVSDSSESDPDKVTVEAGDGKLVWNFDSKYVYYYLFYNAFDYEDVKLEVRADNRGRNSNSISLICRYDPNVGWYEFNIANSGIYDILYAEVTESGKISYQPIANGGSLAIKQGKEVNEYAITCKGDDLTLQINGEQVKTLTEKKYGLRSGQVGMSVSSFNVLPILIEMDWVKISEP
jgi:3-keto-disaccharide hydrolase